jgi:hypothetical protein
LKLYELLYSSECVDLFIILQETRAYKTFAFSGHVLFGYEVLNTKKESFAKKNIFAQVIIIVFICNKLYNKDTNNFIYLHNL